MVKDFLAMLFTPGGALIGTLLLLAAGAAGPGIKQGLQGAAEFWRARFAKNGNGKIKQADQPGEQTAEGCKDLKALLPQVAEADVNELRGRLQQLGEAQRAGQEFLQEQITALSSDVALCNKGLEESKQALSDARRDIPIDTARRVLGALRKYGVESFPERRRKDVPVPAERRVPDPGE